MSAAEENKPAEAKSIGRHGRAALRIAGRRAGENRWTRAFYRGGSSLVGSVGHVVHALWLEVTGFLFLVLSAIGAGRTVREYQRYAAGVTTRNRVVLAGLFTLLFLYFGIESFVRARRKNKWS